MTPRIESPDESDWTAVGDSLISTAADGSGKALRDRLALLATQFATTAGDVDASILRRHLHGLIRSDAHKSIPGWSALSELDLAARAAVSRTILKPDGSHLTLSRASARAGLEEAMIFGTDLVVTGESGVGKSALVMDAIESAEFGIGRQAIAVNLRHLPRELLVLIQQLSSPVDDLLKELTAPERFLIIDGAEVCEHSDEEVFKHLVNAARRADTTVIVVVSTGQTETVRKLLTQPGEPPAERVVIGLSDDEIRGVSGDLPSLSQLYQNEHSRELLRRPIFVELLARLAQPGLPLTEVEALDAVWGEHVRKDTETNLSFASRERVMFLLAEHALGADDNVVEGLNERTVDALIDAGLLAKRGKQPWEHTPAFRHDILRFYAIARYLVRKTTDPTAELLRFAVPRSVLPAARLACQIVLQAPDEANHPLGGRFKELQARFDQLAISAGNERWSEVPGEAVLLVAAPIPILADAWPTLLENGTHGLERLVRLVLTRHQTRGLLETSIAEPLIVSLLEKMPGGLQPETWTNLKRRWLETHAFLLTPPGQATRIAIRDAILADCSQAEHTCQEMRSDQRRKGIERIASELLNPQTATAQPTTPNLSWTPSSSPNSRVRDDLTIWMDKTRVQLLGLLGADINSEAEGLLRRAAQGAPYWLESVVENGFAACSLAAFSPELLVDLATAFYLETARDEWSNGIRSHTFRGINQEFSSPFYGPFLPLFRHDPIRGIAFLNRMLNHAAKGRENVGSRFEGFELPGEAVRSRIHLSISGEEREYAGDRECWLWYRGKGVGPAPCMSALKALEYAIEEFAQSGVPVARMATLLLKDAENLAMPALALALLVRHLEKVGDAIDPYIREPAIWDLEWSRIVHEHRQISQEFLPKTAPNTDRRFWSLNDVTTFITVQARDNRIAELQSLGEQLLTKATTDLDLSTPNGRKRTAQFQNFAKSLDRDSYGMIKTDGGYFFQQFVDPNLEQIFGEANAEADRTNTALGLSNHHKHDPNTGETQTQMTGERLVEDIELAKELMENPPVSEIAILLGGPNEIATCVAGTVVASHFNGWATATDHDLAWAVRLLFGTADAINESPADPADPFERELFSKPRDLAVAASLPFLLLPQAATLRTATGVGDAQGIHSLIEYSRAPACRTTNQARLAYAIGLDVVWSTPCESNHLHGQCHHKLAFNLLSESFNNSLFGPTESSGRTRLALIPFAAETLDSVNARDIDYKRLTPAIRAAGSAAISSACIAQEARAMLAPLIRAHQRALKTSEFGYHHGHSHSLVACRAALMQTIGGDDEPIFSYLRAYHDHPRLLAESLEALATAASEHRHLGDQARRLWPKIIDSVLDEAATNPQILNDEIASNFVAAELVPIIQSPKNYLTTEAAGPPIRWADLLEWESQIVRWIKQIPPKSANIDRLVIAVHDLDLQDQIRTGIDWITQLARRDKHAAANTRTLPDWLSELRSHVTPDQQQKWQNLVDLLTVAGDTRMAALSD